MTQLTTYAAAAPEAQAAMKRILTAAWLAVIAGVAAQLLVICVRMAFGGTIPPANFLADMAQGVTWSFLVCAAIAVGTLGAKARASLAGLLGLLAGPLAWASAKGVQKGVQAIGGVPQDQLTPLFWTVCVVKGIEYAVLGAALMTLVGRPHAKLSNYLTLGAVLGGASASIVVALHTANAALAGDALAPARAAALAANEVFFMLACCMVIYTAQTMTKHAAALRG